MPNEPLIKLEPGGVASILSYNLPEPTSYCGRNIIELNFTEDCFTPKAKQNPTQTSRIPISKLDFSTLSTTVSSNMKSGFHDTRLFPNVNLQSGIIKYSEKSNPYMGIVGTVPIHPNLAQLTPEEVTNALQSGKRLHIYRSMYGTLNYKFVPEPIIVRPRILIVEKYRLSTYLGSYGAGRVISTFSLFPLETTTISIRSYMKTETEVQNASTIFDSFSQESADSFENSVQSEWSMKETSSESSEYSADAGLDWGFIGIDASAGAAGSSSSSREEFAKNVTNATQKHSYVASSKRDVQINTNYKAKDQTIEETSLVRNIQNKNSSRTLNLVFRQMNQEFFTILHLVDVRVAFFNGFTESKKEVTLPDLDILLDEYIVQNKRKQVRDFIIRELQNVFDYKNVRHEVVDEKALNDEAGQAVPGTKYPRFKRDIVSEYKDDCTGTKILVPGVILSATKSVIRTEGVIVEALLGQGEALDKYEKQLRENTIQRMEAESKKLKAEADRSATLNNLIEAKEYDKAKELADIISSINKAEKENESKELTEQ